MNSSANKAFPINFLWFGIIFPIQWPVKPVKSMAMRAVLRCHCPLAGHFVTCKVLVTSPNMWSRWVTALKVKKMGFAGWSQAKRFRSSATSAGRSLWLVASCLRLGSRQMGSSTLRWEAPTSCSQRNLRLQLRIEMRRWCANPSTCSSIGPQRRRSMSEAWDLTSVVAAQEMWARKSVCESIMD